MASRALDLGVSAGAVLLGSDEHADINPAARIAANSFFILFFSDDFRLVSRSRIIVLTEPYEFLP
jgi:hypothetical protein